MRYEQVTKRVRNQSIVKFKLANPDMSLKEIGEIFGISRQRVWMIFKTYVSRVK